MTEKPNSVCKWCLKPIEVCLGESPDSTGQCKGYVHVAPRTHFCPGHVAEPAEPSASPTIKEMSDASTIYKMMLDSAAPQPVAGEGPQQWRKLPVGYWFFLDSPICTNRYSVQERTDSGCTLICSTPWHHDGAKTDMQRIADLHNSRLAEGTPKLEEIRQKCVNFLCQYSHPAVDELAQFVEKLRPFITPAGSPPNTFFCEQCKADKPIDEQYPNCPDSTICNSCAEEHISGKSL